MAGGSLVSLGEFSQTLIGAIRLSLFPSLLQSDVPGQALAYWLTTKVIATTWARGYRTQFAMPGVTTVTRYYPSCGNLFPSDDFLRSWFSSEFFSYHLSHYSFSQAKAPIYWQLSTQSGSFSVWLYVHAFTNDTLFRVQNEYVA